MLLLGPGQGSHPSTHAFVLGVSHYPFLDGPEATAKGAEFGMEDLSGAARSASEVAAWLLTEYRNPERPLADITLFLSPGQGEELAGTVVDAMAGQQAPAVSTDVRAGLQDFRERCREDPGNLAFVYFVGHGIQLNKHGAVIFLQDVGADRQNLLDATVDVAGCRDAMDEDGNASHQVWFSDACRQRPDVVRRFERLADAWRLDEGGGQVDASVLFLAASSREAAFAEVGGTSIFTQALLWALRGKGGADAPDATCPDWYVPATQLIKLLPQRVKELLADYPEDQHVDVTGRVLDMVAQRLAAPPDVDIEVAFSPGDLEPQPTAELLFRTVTPQQVEPGWPLRFTGPPGIYKATATSNGRHGETVFNADPPQHHESIEVAP
jgi:Caspase domain